MLEKELKPASHMPGGSKPEVAGDEANHLTVVCLRLFGCSPE